MHIVFDCCFRMAGTAVHSRRYWSFQYSQLSLQYIWKWNIWALITGHGIGHKYYDKSSEESYLRYVVRYMLWSHQHPTSYCARPFHSDRFRRPDRFFHNLGPSRIFSHCGLLLPEKKKQRHYQSVPKKEYNWLRVLSFLWFFLVQKSI